jgi:hypothetical protein
MAFTLDQEDVNSISLTGNIYFYFINLKKK